MKYEDCLYKNICNLDCKPSCIRYVEVKFLLDSSNIPKSLQKINELVPEYCDMPSYLQLSEIRDNILDFVTCGKQLYVYSENCGNGKTTWAIKLALQYFNEVWAGNGFKKRVLFINIPEFLATYKSVISNPNIDFENLKNSIPYVDLVIWDDIGVSKLTEYENSLLIMYINNRIMNRLANIYTSNILPCDLKKMIGERLSSRVLGECTKIQLKGGDNR